MNEVQTKIKIADKPKTQKILQKTEIGHILHPTLRDAGSPIIIDYAYATRVSLFHRKEQKKPIRHLTKSTFITHERLTSTPLKAIYYFLRRSVIFAVGVGVFCSRIIWSIT
jgi:hypothetical protein